MRRKHLLAPIVGLALSGVFLWLALRNTNFTDVGRSLSNAEWLYCIPMLAAFWLHFWIKAMRWRLILSPICTAKTSELFAPMMIGFFGNNILPARLGEFIRIYLGAQRLKLSNTQVFATVFLERLFDVLTIVVLVGALLLFVTALPAQLAQGALYALLLAIVLLIALIVYGVWTDLSLRIAAQLLFFLPEKYQVPILHHLQLGASGLHSLRSPQLILGIAVTSLLQWLLSVLTIYMSLLAVGVYINITAAVVVLAFTVVAVSIPAAPGFFGSIQFAFVLALKPFAIDEASAVAASVYFHVLTYSSVTLLGFYLIHRWGYKLRQLQKISKDQSV